MRKLLSQSLAALVVFTLAACGKSASDDQASSGNAGAVKAAGEVAFQMQPGKYRTTIEIQKVDLPGMPASDGARMKAMMSRVATQEFCVTPEQAAKGIEAMKQQMARGKCQFDKFEASAGKIDSVLACQSGKGMTMKVSSHGTYSPSGSRVQSVGDIVGPAGKPIHIEQAITTERIGDCT
jgi:hypothetical protein